MTNVITLAAELATSLAASLMSCIKAVRLFPPSVESFSSCKQIRHNAVQCSAVQCNAMQRNATQHNTTQYNTINMYCGKILGNLSSVARKNNSTKQNQKGNYSASTLGKAFPERPKGRKTKEMMDMIRKYIANGHMKRDA